MAEYGGNERAEGDLRDLRRLSFGIAYRMLGSVADAEDVVQEALLRLHRVREQGSEIESPRSFLAAITTRLTIDHLRSARVRRENYLGSWLPEPVVEGSDSALTHVEMGESLSLAFLTILESLSPVERAVFLLREAFDYDYAEIARIVDKNEQNCRQLFARARKHLDAGKPRFASSPAQRTELAESFFAACEQGDLSALEAFLAADATFFGDGGGKATAVAHPITGRERVAKFLLGLFAKARQYDVRIYRTLVNGEPGAMLFDSDNRLLSVMALHIADGSVAAVHSVVNPDKLRHLGPVSDWLRLPERRPT